MRERGQLVDRLLSYLRDVKSRSLNFHNSWRKQLWIDLQPFQTCTDRLLKCVTEKNGCFNCGLNEVDILFLISAQLHLCGMTSVVVWFCLQKCQHTAGRKIRIVFFHNTHRVNDQLCVSGKEAEQIPAATAVTSALYCDAQTCVTTNHFPFCYWTLKQGTIGQAGNKGWLSINVQMQTSGERF